MGSLAKALAEFYSGEVLGEAVYSGLLAAARSDDERFKWANLLQLETEAKAYLRRPMVASGLSIAEEAADREKGAKIAGHLSLLPWPELMQALDQAITRDYLPRFQAYADAARARGAAAESAVCQYMVEHEQAQVEFARRELAGSSLEHSLEPLRKFLKYPLRD